MAAFKVTDPFIRTGARESSSWPGVRSTSRPDTFLQTTSDNLEFLLDAKRRTIHFYKGDKIKVGSVVVTVITPVRRNGKLNLRRSGR
jgi:hypothetical protein